MMTVWEVLMPRIPDDIQNRTVYLYESETAAHDGKGWEERDFWLRQTLLEKDLYGGRSTSSSSTIIASATTKDWAIGSS
jgi:hypothetical protein